MNRWLAVAVVMLGGCTLGLSGGGAYSVKSSPNPRPGGFHGRVVAGAGWGTRYGNISALGAVSHVAQRSVVSVGAEIAVAFKPWKHDVRDGGTSEEISGPALLGRVLCGGADGIRITELAIGPGAGMFSTKHGPGTLALYATAALATDEMGRTGWSHGIELSFSVPLSGIVEEMKEQR